MNLYFKGNNNQETTQGQTNAQAPLPSLGKGFPGSKFKHGITFDGVFNDDDYKRYDYISMWINSPHSDDPTNTDYNPYWQGTMIKKCKQLGKIPVFYGYIIAFEARAKNGLQDCDVDPINNLCHKGANFIRNNRALLVSRYTHQASKIAEALGDRNAPCVFIMEPDFWQYYGDHTQEGGSLSGEYMRALFDDFAKEIRKQLPKAKISWDLSAWIGYQGMSKWWGYFKTSPYIDFVHTSGGQVNKKKKFLSKFTCTHYISDFFIKGRGGSTEYKPGELKWSDFSKITGKRIIADCGINN